MKTKPTEIELLVTRAILIDRRIQDDADELKAIKARLVEAAEAEPEDRRDATKEGGYSITFSGGDGSIARVTRPGDKLRSSIDTETPKGAKLKERVGKMWSDLFEPRVQWTPVAKFREVVAEKFALRDANAIIKACTTESAPKVSFETKEVA